MSLTPEAAAEPRELHYRVGSPVLGHFPGRHRSARGDSGFEFRGHAKLHDAPDPRRLDLHASLRDPFGDWIVRVYSQRQSIPVVLLADVSASMALGNGPRRIDVLADLAHSLAWSAWRSGDAYGLIACDETVREDLLLLPTRARGAGLARAQDLRALRPRGHSAHGLLDAHRWLGRQRALVFLVSDFHLPAPELAAVLSSLARHDVLPVVLGDPAEFDLGLRSGWARLVDPETGQRRLVWWRPALRERWLRHAQQRREALDRLFAAQRLKPLYMAGAFDADAVTRHFQA